MMAATSRRLLLLLHLRPHHPYPYPYPLRHFCYRPSSGNDQIIETLPPENSTSLDHINNDDNFLEKTKMQRPDQLRETPPPEEHLFEKKNDELVVDTMELVKELESIAAKVEANNNLVRQNSRLMDTLEHEYKELNAKILDLLRETSDISCKMDAEDFFILDTLERLWPVALTDEEWRECNLDPVTKSKVNPEITNMFYYDEDDEI